MPDSAATTVSLGDDLLDGLVETATNLPFNRHLGVEIRHLEVGAATTALPADERLANHLGGVHAIAELAPVELAGALAASTRLRPLLERGHVPVVGALEVRYLAAGRGELTATATLGEDALEPALAAADAGERPRVELEVVVSDDAGTQVLIAWLRFVYLTPDEVAGQG